MNSFKLSNGFEIGGSRVGFIAEIGLCHNGSLDVAKTLIDISKEAGADFVKFQKRDVDNLAIGSVLDAPDNRFPSFGNTYRKVREFIEFSPEEYSELYNHCKKREIPFTCTPFDSKSFAFLREFDMPFIKIASHSLTNLPLISEIAASKIPTLMSTGMCTWEEIDDAVELFKKAHCPIALFHCVSSYPTSHDEANLPMINELKSRYEIPVGLSTHEQGILATLTGIGAGAQFIERHVTLDHNLEGFDHKIAVDPQEMRKLISSIREIEKMMTPHAKEISEAEMVTRNKYRVSAVTVKDLPAGSKLEKDHFEFKNPGTGIAPRDLDKYIGRSIKSDVKADTILTADMID